ncbi:hypothetical protein BHE74_00014704 [Ensete ventricosum]|nr:hypothetical protein BHE74_00014704 [Ensete ventricosum]
MGSSFRWDELILHGAKDEGSFKAHAPYLRDAFDGETKVIQLTKAKLGSGDLSTGQEDTEAGTLEEYATVVERGEEATSPEGLSYPKSKVSVRKEVDSEERHSAVEADLPIMKGHKCKAMDSRAMGLAAPWYRRDGISVESSIPCFHGGEHWS